MKFVYWVKWPKHFLIKNSERFKELLGLIHTNIYRPMTIHAIDRYTYFIIFTNDRFKYDYVYLMKYMSESVERFKEFKSEVEKEIGNSIKIFWFNQGGE